MIELNRIRFARWCKPFGAVDQLTSFSVIPIRLFDRSDRKFFVLNVNQDLALVKRKVSPLFSVHLTVANRVRLLNGYKPFGAVDQSLRFGVIPIWLIIDFILNVNQVLTLVKWKVSPYWINYTSFWFDLNLIVFAYISIVVYNSVYELFWFWFFFFFLN